MKEAKRTGSLRGKRRRPKARWGYRPPGYNDNDAQRLSKQQFETILRSVPIRLSKLQFVEALDSVNQIANAAQGWRYVDETDVSVGEQRAALREIHSLIYKLSNCMSDVDLTTRKTIYSNYPSTSIRDEDAELATGYDLFVRDVEALNRLKHAVSNAIHSLPKSPGKPNVKALRPVCRDLAKIFEHYSGKRFSLDRLRKTIGPESFLSPGSLFVALVMQIIWPGATVAQLETAMKHVVKTRVNWSQITSSKSNANLRANTI